MLVKTITYTDYNGVERTEDFYFNLTKAEMMEMELGVTGGFTTMIQRVVATQDGPAIMRTFKDVILKAYGVKSDDGKKMIKNQAVRDEFAQTEAYSILFMELLTDENAAREFLLHVIPSDTAVELRKSGKLEIVNKQE